MKPLPKQRPEWITKMRERQKRDRMRLAMQLAWAHEAARIQLQYQMARAHVRVID